MPRFKHYTKRVLTDAAGYALLVMSALAAPIPGPGGLPLAIAALGLLSIHNTWAQRLRSHILEHGGRVTKVLFPRHALTQWTYDVIVLLLYILAAVLIWRRAAYWQISLAISAFFVATTIALLNRDRLERIKLRARRQPKA